MVSPSDAVDGGRAPEVRAGRIAHVRERGIGQQEAAGVRAGPVPAADEVQIESAQVLALVTHRNRIDLDAEAGGPGHRSGVPIARVTDRQVVACGDSLDLVRHLAVTAVLAFGAGTGPCRRSTRPHRARTRRSPPARSLWCERGRLRRPGPLPRPRTGGRRGIARRRCRRERAEQEREREQDRRRAPEDVERCPRGVGRRVRELVRAPGRRVRGRAPSQLPPAQPGERNHRGNADHGAHEREDGCRRQRVPEIVAVAERRRSTSTTR